MEVGDIAIFIGIDVGKVDHWALTAQIEADAPSLFSGGCASTGGCAATRGASGTPPRSGPSNRSTCTRSS